MQHTHTHTNTKILSSLNGWMVAALVGSTVGCLVRSLDVDGWGGYVYYNTIIDQILTHTHTM